MRCPPGAMAGAPRGSTQQHPHHEHDPAVILGLADE